VIQLTIRLDQNVYCRPKCNNEVCYFCAEYSACCAECLSRCFVNMSEVSLVYFTSVMYIVCFYGVMFID